MLAYTGLETVANLAAETREPGRTLPRSLFVGIGASGAHLVPDRPGRASPRIPPIRRRPARHDLAARAARRASPTRSTGTCPGAFVDALRVFIGLTGAMILIAVVTTSISGAGRLAYSLGKHDMLPRPFGRLSRRTLISPAAILSAAAISTAVLLDRRAPRTTRFGSWRASTASASCSRSPPRRSP